MKINLVIPYLIILIALAGMPEVAAQDLIITVDKTDTISCRITLVGPEQIQYYLWDDPDEKIEILKRQQVLRILYENGRVVRVSEAKPQVADYAHQSNLAIKLDVFSTLYSTTSFSFEKSISTRKSIELGVGLIGIGLYKDEHLNPSGLYLRAGMKYFFRPLTFKKTIESHLLKGWYLRPELAINMYRQNDYYREINFHLSQNKSTIVSDYFERYERKSAAIILNAGKQWVFGNHFCMDLFFGVGAGWGSQKFISTRSFDMKLPDNDSSTSANEEDNPFLTGILISHHGGYAIAMQLGFKLGYLFSVR